jgi:hypothetical protein
MKELYEALKELVRLKEIKDNSRKGFDEIVDYQRNKPIAWEKAKQALSNYENQPEPLFTNGDYIKLKAERDMLALKLKIDEPVRYPELNEAFKISTKSNQPAKHNQAIADIINEIKRSPAIVSEQKYNEWYVRILDEINKPEQLSGGMRWVEESIRIKKLVENAAMKKFKDYPGIGFDELSYKAYKEAAEMILSEVNRFMETPQPSTIWPEDEVVFKAALDYANLNSKVVKLSIHQKCYDSFIAGVNWLKNRNK